MAQDFADQTHRAHALEWDEAQAFPGRRDARSRGLGMAAIYCARTSAARADAPGRRADFRSAGDRPSRDRGLHVHPQHVRVDDRHATASPEQRKFLPQLAAWSSRQLLPDRAGRRLGRRGVENAPAPRRRIYVLDGVKQFISGAGASDIYVVMARTGEAGRRAAYRRSSSKRERPGLGSAPTSARWAGTRSRPPR